MLQLFLNWFFAGSMLLSASFVASPAAAQVRNPRNIPYQWKTDTTRRLVNLQEIMVAVPRSTFPSIDFPAFVGKQQGLNQFLAHEPVIAVALNGEARAYPLNMLSIHELANDSLGGIPILPTYCPLCNAAIVFDRRLQHEGKEYLLSFEVSGMLRNSDMVMFDRQTETWWQQLMGQAIVGKLAGAELQLVPSLIISVEDFFTRYPEGSILSRNTGNPRAEAAYGINYYEGYDDPESRPYEVFFDSAQLDPRLPPMERVVDISHEGSYKIYPFSAIARKGVINDSFKGKDIAIFYQEKTISVLDKREISTSRTVGSATVFRAALEGMRLTFRKDGPVFKDQQTHSTWDITGQCIAGPLSGKQLPIEPHSNHFAFAWLAFHPESLIYKDSDQK